MEFSQSQHLLFGFGLLALGLTLLVSHWVKLAIVAFHESLAWGFAFLLVPFVGLVFIIRRWDETCAPFIALMGGLGATLIGLVLSFIHLISWP